jgi:hypothetical protein
MVMNFKKFSDINKKSIKKINEDEQFGSLAAKDVDKANMEAAPKANLPENIEQPQTGESEQNQESTSCVKLFSKLFESREMAHIYHLQVRGDEGSYAAHMALGSFYEDVLEHIDDLIETYQGQYGIVDGYDIIDTKDTKTKDKIAYFEELATYIKDARKCISVEDSHLQNIIDEIVALTYKTLFKLKFNK